MKKYIKLASILFFIFIVFYSGNRYRNYSLSLMPKEYKLVKKIFDKFSLNNDLGNRPVSIILGDIIDEKIGLNFILIK